MNTNALFLLVASTLLIAGCASGDAAQRADAQGRAASAATAQSKFDADRRAILDMAGNYKVRFEFQETVAFTDGYEPKEPYLSGAHEVVLVVEDREDFISLQHILVVGGEEKFPIKHWRQDWRYEPSEVLTFIGGNAWEMRPVDREAAQGKWSQTVYQVDDSPRYGALGVWSHGGGVSQWTPPAEWRPLPRRDMTTRDDYHAVDAVNVHAITPDGWAHEQMNLKVALDGTPRALVREVGINTYDKFDGFESDVATSYWSATKDYWAAVRGIWTEFETPGSAFAIKIKGETEGLYMPLMTYAENVQAGDMTFDDAVAKARETIAAYTTRELPPLQARLREPAAEQSSY